MTWVISHCPLLHYYVISCGSVCLIPDSFRSISRRLPTKWLFRRGGTGRRGACPCSPIGAINHSAERVPLCWVLIDHTWTEQLQQQPQLVDVRGRIIHCICMFFFFKSESVVVKSQSAPAQVQMTDLLIFVLLCFVFNLIATSVQHRGTNNYPKLWRVPENIEFRHLFKANCSNCHHFFICWAVLIAVRLTTFKLFEKISKQNMTISMCGLSAG